ncbi:MAG: hypothetical protein GTN40_05530 [Candidatus Aenigmarchaeota archaeon]|nr:hypothetical protein [Candidatus Aenigmarchaeota archaeon]
MKSLEQQIRLGLGQREKRDIVNYASRHTDLQARFYRASQIYEEHVMKSVERALSRVCVNQDEKEKIRKEATDNLTPFVFYISSLLSYDALLEKAEKKFFKNAKSRKIEREKNYEKLRKNLEGLKPGTDYLNKLEKMKKLNNLYFEFSKVDDILVEILKKIAEEKGIEHVLKDSLIDEVTREIFPTEKEYKDNFELELKTTEEIRNINISLNLKKINCSPEQPNEHCSQCPRKKASDVFNLSLSSVFDGTQEYFNILRSIKRAINEERIERIYKTQ